MNPRQFLTGASAIAVSAALPVQPAVTVWQDIVQPARSDLYVALAEATRKAFVPRLFVQVYVRSPIEIADWYEALDSPPHF